jgi:hypothetical protein
MLSEKAEPGGFRSHHRGIYTRDSDFKFISIGVDISQLKRKSMSVFLCPFLGYSPGVYCEGETVF